MAIFTASAATEGTVAGLGGLLPVASTVTVTTIARDTSHPKTYAAPFRTPFFEASTTMNAVHGSGSTAITRPIRIRLSVTAAPRVLHPKGLPQESRRASPLAGEAAARSAKKDFDPERAVVPPYTSPDSAAEAMACTGSDSGARSR